MNKQVRLLSRRFTFDKRKKKKKKKTAPTSLQILQGTFVASFVWHNEWLAADAPIQRKRETLKSDYKIWFALNTFLRVLCWKLCKTPLLLPSPNSRVVRFALRIAVLSISCHTKTITNCNKPTDNELLLPFLTLFASQLNPAINDFVGLLRLFLLQFASVLSARYMHNSFTLLTSL